MAGEQDKTQHGGHQRQAAAAPQEPQEPTSPGGESGGKPSGVDSATKEGKDAELQQKAAGDAGANAQASAKGVALNHGEPDPFVEEQRKNQLEAAKDPWGTTPLQMRDSHDENVDPHKVGIATRADGSGLVDGEGNPRARGRAHSGIEPGVAGEDAPQGTLPPV